MPNFAPLISILFVILLLFSYSAPAVGGPPWCVASGTAATPEKLQANIDFSCSKIDCAPIRPGGSCFLPNTAYSHASFAMNSYFQTNGKTFDACNFDNTGVVVITDPSYGDCRYL